MIAMGDTCGKDTGSNDLTSRALASYEFLILGS